MVVPTLRCDHNCTYCQVSRVNKDVDGFDLNETDIPKIVKWIRSRYNPPYQIEFQGGEPLLRFDLIKAFFEKMELQAHGSTYVIATSLSLLSRDIIAWAKTKNIQFSVSLDGNEYVHNFSRKHLISSSHSLATENLKLIRDQIGPERLGIVTTVTKGLFDSYKEFIDEVKTIGLREVFLRPLSPYGFASIHYNKGYSIGEYFKFYKQFISYLVSNFDSFGISEASLKIHLRKIYNPNHSSYVDLKSPSGYLLNAVVFDYSGKVFGSDEARMLYKSHQIESLVLDDLRSSGGKLSLDTSIGILANSFISEHPGCNECAYSPFCGSDPMYHLSTQGEPIGNKAISDFCLFQKEMFGFIFSLLDDNSTKGVIEGWLND